MRHAIMCFALWIAMSVCGRGADQPAAQAHRENAGPDLASRLQQKLDEIVETDRLPGATLAVARRDGSVISLASGLEDRETKTHLQPGAQMLVGSTGKTFVSAVALQLVAEGRLKLDDRVSAVLDKADHDWFRDLPNADAITVRSLMNHTSGLPRYIFQPRFLAQLRADPLRKRTPREGLAVLRGLPAVNSVGEGWSYSDSNYLMLGLLIEKTTGREYYAELDRRILKPFKLTHTAPTVAPEVPGLVQGHVGRINPFSLPAQTVQDDRYVLNPAFEWCGGGLVSSVDDLAQWMRALHSGRVLRPEQYTELTQPAPFATGLPGNARYGLGTFIWETEHGVFLGHAGMMPGYLTQIEFSRRHGFAIALQTNTDEGLGRHLHEHVQSVASLLIQ